MNPPFTVMALNNGVQFARDVNIADLVGSPNYDTVSFNSNSVRAFIDRNRGKTIDVLIIHEYSPVSLVQLTKLLGSYIPKKVMFNGGVTLADLFKIDNRYIRLGLIASVKYLWKYDLDRQSYIETCCMVNDGGVLNFTNDLADIIAYYDERTSPAAIANIFDMTYATISLTRAIPARHACVKHNTTYTASRTHRWAPESPARTSMDSLASVHGKE